LIQSIFPALYNLIHHNFKQALSYRWQSVYYHFQKWSKDGSWEVMWQVILNKHKAILDLSCVQLDGTHTPTKRGGEAVDYQGRKKCKTSNMLIISDSRGIPVVCSDAISGNHNDAYRLKENAEHMIQSLEDSHIAIEGLFLNADAGFDSKEFRVKMKKKNILTSLTWLMRSLKRGVSRIFCNSIKRMRF
jgi:transposase